MKEHGLIIRIRIKQRTTKHIFDEYKRLKGFSTSEELLNYLLDRKIEKDLRKVTRRIEIEAPRMAKN